METVLEGKNPSKSRDTAGHIRTAEWISAIGISNPELHIEDSLSLGGQKKGMDGATIEKVTLTNPIRLVRIYRYCVPYIHQFHKKKVLFRPQAIWLDFDYRQKSKVMQTVYIAWSSSRVCKKRAPCIYRTKVRRMVMLA